MSGAGGALDALVPAVGALRTHAGPGDGAEPRTLAARAVLAALAEPGDGVMGELVAALGAETTASLVCSDRGAAEIAAQLRSIGAVPPAGLAKALQRWRPRDDRQAIARGLAQAARLGVALVVPGDAIWPAMLDDLGHHAPLALWVRGDPGLVGDGARSIALVGARAATAYGQQIAIEAAAGLADRGFTIVSGGAYGIDGAAHRSALRSDGATVAFLAGGVDRFYPIGHEALLSEIAARGAVVSELPCGEAPTKWRFLTRNRLIAAASAGVVVVEAGRRSGSLNTARHAAELGRALGAVPGPVTSPASAGCHHLLRETDAICVTDAAEMAELVGGFGTVALWDDGADPRAAAASDGGAPSQAAALLDRLPDARRVVDAMSTRRFRSIAEIARLAGVEPSRAIGVLGTLEALGGARRSGDDWRAVPLGRGVGGRP
ncbi:DNA-processing protein DprA [Agromyces soli]